MGLDDCKAATSNMFGNINFCPILLAAEVPSWVFWSLSSFSTVWKPTPRCRQRQRSQ